MRPSEGAAGRWQATGTAGQTRESTAILDDHRAAGKQADGLLALHRLCLELQAADTALLALMFAGVAR